MSGKLETYRSKRDFRRTAEPAGADQAASEGHLYVMQKHAATHDHFDLRLEQKGVLRSWALPKGPSLEPGEKRLAVEVEDHPLEYGRFEGVIPQGEYGGGTVMLWDTGYWQLIGKASRDKLDFEIHGEKLSGRWSLVRMHGKRSGQDKKAKNWLLIKRSDPEPAILKPDDLSVVSGRSMEEIAHQDGRDEADRAPGARGRPEAKSLAEAHKRPLPQTPSPQLATLVDRDTRVAGVRLSSADRILYPQQGVTKLELARYYEAIADWILPHLANRPLSLLRCPEGREQACFFQKHPGKNFAKGVPRIAIEEKRGTVSDFLYVENVRDLVELVQFNVLEFHPWGSRVEDLEAPDTLIFDLDPGPDVVWGRLADAAAQLRQRLVDLGLTPFLQATGGNGLHLVVPIEPTLSWGELKAFARAVSQLHARGNPEALTTNMAKSKRQGRIFIDYLRNDRGNTAIARYSTRARENAPVATPLRWDELTPSAGSNRYTLHNIRRRLSALKADPWAGYVKARTAVTARMRRQVGVD